MNLKAWFAEFIGTFGFVFIGVGSVVVMGADKTSVSISPAVAHGFALAIMITITAAISGGHINPAVTVGAWLANKIKLVDALGYIFAQLVGATIAVWAMVHVFPSGLVESALFGLPAFGTGVEKLQGFAIEAIGTFFLVFTVFATCIDKRGPKMGGFFVGMSVLVMAIALGPMSGGGFNPARYFGPALMASNFTTFAAHIVGPILGGAAAALLYTYLFAEKETGPAGA